MVSESREQRIRDPLYNLVVFRKDNKVDQLAWKIIQSPLFQRLRRIKQLGFSDFVYPGATHTRFAHSIGVYHVARRLIQIIDRCLGKDQSDSEGAKTALLAALVHDIGHGPFSHAFEDVSKELKLNIPKHEDISAWVVRNCLGAEFDEFGVEGLQDSVAKRLEKVHTSDIYGSVVSSQFDADRLDYMQRDRLMTGTQLGSVDMEWLLENLMVGRVPIVVDSVQEGERETFVLSPKASHAAEAYVLGLFLLYPTVYYHKTTRGVEKQFAQLISHLFTLRKDNEKSWHTRVNLPKAHPLVMFVKEPKEKNILELDDTVIWGALSLMKSAKDGEVASAAQDLLNRNALRCIDVGQRVEARLIEEMPDKIDDVRKKSYKCCVKIEEKLKESNFKSILLDKDDRKLYKPYDESTGVLNQMRIKPSKDSSRNLDFRHFTRTLNTQEEFSFFRVYLKRDDNGTALCDEIHKLIDKTADEEMA